MYINREGREKKQSNERMRRHERERYYSKLDEIGVVRGI